MGRYVGNGIVSGAVERDRCCSVCDPKLIDSKDTYGCIKIYSEGWKCICCGTIWAPSIKYCKKCETRKESKENIKDIKE